MAWEWEAERGGVVTTYHHSAYLPYLECEHRDIADARKLWEGLFPSGTMLLNERQRRQLFQFIRDAWVSPDVLPICADWLEDVAEKPEASEFVRENPTCVRALMLLGFCGASARGWLSGLMAQMRRMAQYLSDSRRQEWDGHLLHAATALGIIDDLEICGLPYVPGGGPPAEPPLTMTVSYSTSRAHCARLGWSRLNGNEVYADVHIVMAPIIAQIDHALVTLDAIPWTGFSPVHFPMIPRLRDFRYG